MLLGAIWSIKRRIGTGAFGVQDAVLMVIAGVGLFAISLVAGRIVFVTGEVKKRLREEAARDRSRPTR